MTVGSFCNRSVVICHEDDSVREAARRMRGFDVGAVVVVEEKDGVRRPVGVLTDRDIVLALAGPDFDAETLRVRDLMSSGVVTAVEEESLEDGLKRMRAHGVRRMPVVNEEGGLEGLVTLDDLLAQVSEDLQDLSRLLAREKHWKDQGEYARPR